MELEFRSEGRTQRVETHLDRDRALATVILT
jgi:hypothetical protein